MVNGIGGRGSCTQCRPIFVARSVAKGVAVSSVVSTMCHVDHTEQDVDILANETTLR
jgi:succinyl-CoA:acetate CoA-transferase